MGSRGFLLGWLGFFFCSALYADCTGNLLFQLASYDPQKLAPTRILKVAFGEMDEDVLVPAHASPAEKEAIQKFLSGLPSFPFSSEQSRDLLALPSHPLRFVLKSRQIFFSRREIYVGVDLLLSTGCPYSALADAAKAGNSPINKE